MASALAGFQAACAFDAVGGGAALRFRRATADRPALFPKLRIVDQVAALGHVVQQLVDRFLFCGSSDPTAIR